MLKVCRSLGELLVFSPHWEAEESALQFHLRMATVAATGQIRSPGSTRTAGEHSTSFLGSFLCLGGHRKGRSGFFPPQLSLSGRALTDYYRGLTLT